ncbi:MAG TPA: glycosyltransferase family 2 protein [Thermoanaerobaculia bacterium]
MPSSPPPRLSIVIPTHGTRELTLRCLESLERSAPPETEILLVDDGSRDGTAEAIATRFPSVRVLRNEEPAGFTRAANQGLETARGILLLLLNSDTEVEPPALDALAARFAADTSLGVVGAALHYPDGSPQWSGGAEPSLAWFFALSSGLPALLRRLPFYRRIRPLAAEAGPRRVGWVTGAALAIRREAWEAAGPLDERFRFYGQDLDLCLRVRQAGWEVEVAPGFRVLHHHGATIGRDSGAVGILGRQHPALLWTDLLRWARKHKGERWAARAARALRWGAALRLAGRRLARPLVPAGTRRAWDADRGPLAEALRALRQGEESR